MECNASFKVATESAAGQALTQYRGLPIGGHFSAALVELVALWRECTQPRPQSVAALPTARYRDNYFVAWLLLRLRCWIFSRWRLGFPTCLLCRSSSSSRVAMSAASNCASSSEMVPRCTSQWPFEQALTAKERL